VDGGSGVEDKEVVWKVVVEWKIYRRLCGR
jgi:hypothetical protein